MAGTISAREKLADRLANYQFRVGFFDAGFFVILVGFYWICTTNEECFMKKLAVIGLLVFCQLAMAQQAVVSFAEIDERVKSIDVAPLAQLAQALTKDYATDREKLRAIFSWITAHISYRVKKNNLAVLTGNRSRQVKDSAVWQSGNDFVAETVLQNRSAVCDGYARLFKSLCDYAGLRSVIVSGFANGDYSRQFAFRANHSWNAVYIDSAWQLLDVTWASGYTNYRGDEFVKRFDDSYFLASPEAFARDHFPDDLRWALLQKLALPSEFGTSPYRNRAFSKYRISSYLPASGSIEASQGDTITIELQAIDRQQDSQMMIDTIAVMDDALQPVLSSVALLETADTASTTPTLRYSYYVQNPSVEWLHIVYNHDTILRYHLKIRRDKSGFKWNAAPALLADPLWNDCEDLCL